MRAPQEVREDLVRVTTMPNRFMKKLEVEMLLDIRDILDRIRESLRIISLKP